VLTEQLGREPDHVQHQGAVHARAQLSTTGVCPRSTELPSNSSR
jgi:hypothetical protein